MSCPFSHNSNYSSLDGRLFRASGADSTHRVQQTRTGSIGGIVLAAAGPRGQPWAESWAEGWFNRGHSPGSRGSEGPALGRVLGRGPAHMSSSTRLTLTGQEACPTYAANPTLTGTPDCAPPVAQPSYPQCGLYPETGPGGGSLPPGRGRGTAHWPDRRDASHDTCSPRSRVRTTCPRYRTPRACAPGCWGGGTMAAATRDSARPPRIRR